MSEIYVSTDIETNGWCPGKHSMLSLGSAAFDPEKGLVSTFSVNLIELEGTSPDPRTMSEFWDKNPEAWKACRENTRDPEEAMQDYDKWIKRLPGKSVFVGYPAGFDFSFVYYYFGRFGIRCPFSFSAIDIKTYAMAMLKKDYRSTTKRSMPARWFSEKPHTHVALDDAIEQGELFMNMLKENVGAALSK